MHVFMTIVRTLPSLVSCHIVLIVFKAAVPLGSCHMFLTVVKTAVPFRSCHVFLTVVTKVLPFGLCHIFLPSVKTAPSNELSFYFRTKLILIVTFRPLVKQTTTRNLYITIYIYFLDGRLCEVGAVRRGIRIVRRWGLNFSMSGDGGRDNAHCVTTREVSWTAGSFFLYLLLFNSSALYNLQTPTQR